MGQALREKNMRIAFIIIGNTERGGEIDGESIRYGSVTSSGTDSSAILAAEYLASVGHEVVFAIESRSTVKNFKNVTYTDVQFNGIENKTFDILVTSLWFSNFDTLKIKVTNSLIYWCHLSWMYSIREMVEYCNTNQLKFGVVHVSKWEQGHNRDTVDFMRKNVHKGTSSIVIPNAIVTDVGTAVLNRRLERIPKKVTFHAQWSRGGPTALETVRKLGWDESKFGSFDYLRSDSKWRFDKRGLFGQLAESEYFIFPSFTHGKLIYKDTFSCAIAEALMMGVVVVTYRLGALPEYYNDYCEWAEFPDGTDLEKMNSEKVSEDPNFGRVDTLVEAVERLERNPQKKLEMSAKGTQYVLNNFSIEKIGPIWNEYLRSIYES